MYLVVRKVNLAVKICEMFYKNASIRIRREVVTAKKAIRAIRRWNLNPDTLFIRFKVSPSDRPKLRFTRYEDTASIFNLLCVTPVLPENGILI